MLSNEDSTRRCQTVYQAAKPPKKKVTDPMINVSTAITTFPVTAPSWLATSVASQVSICCNARGRDKSPVGPYQ
jgi:hypothetical protein